MQEEAELVSQIQGVGNDVIGWEDGAQSLFASFQINFKNEGKEAIIGLEHKAQGHVAFFQIKKQKRTSGWEGRIGGRFNFLPNTF